MTAKKAYHALFESHLRYRITWWGGSKVRNLQQILNLQKLAIRNLRYLQPREAFWDLEIITVANLYILIATTYVHIKAHGTAIMGTQIHPATWLNTVSKCTVRVPKKKKSSYTDAKKWNNLLVELKQRGHHNGCKINYTTLWMNFFIGHFIRKTMYSDPNLKACEITNFRHELNIFTFVRGL